MLPEWLVFHCKCQLKYYDPRWLCICTASVNQNVMPPEELVVSMQVSEYIMPPWVLVSCTASVKQITMLPEWLVFHSKCQLKYYDPRWLCICTASVNQNAMPPEELVVSMQVSMRIYYAPMGACILHCKCQTDNNASRVACISQQVSNTILYPIWLCISLQVLIRMLCHQRSLWFHCRCQL